MPLRDFYGQLVRLLLGYIFASSGLCKLTGGHFGQLIGPPVAQMLTPEVAAIWTFLAISQVLVGALTLSGRWGTLGLVALVPINTTILAYTTANNWTGTPFVNASLLVLNVLALLLEWPTLRVFLQPDATPAPLRGPRQLPGWRLPALAIGTLMAAALLARPLPAPAPLVIGLGGVGFAAAWLHVARGVGWPERAVLAGTGAAVLALTVAPLISLRLGSLAMLGGLLGGALGCLALALRWVLARRRASTVAG